MPKAKSRCEVYMMIHGRINDSFLSEMQEQSLKRLAVKFNREIRTKKMVAITEVKNAIISKRIFRVTLLNGAEK